MNNYLCANKHHFRSKTPRCPSPGCNAEVRPTAISPSTDGSVPNFKHLPRLPGQPAGRPSPIPDGTKHSIRWWAYIDSGRSRRTSSMRDNEYRWDATCACGWDSATGGDTMANVDKLVAEHKRG